MLQNPPHRDHTASLDDDSMVVFASGLRCAYGDFEAVHGIDLHIRRGEFFALLGTNGAGKTTAMETLEGHRRASAGTLRVLGGDPATQRKKIRPRMGIMLQESGFAGDLTVAETIRVWLKLSSSLAAQPANREGAIADSLATLDLTNRAATRVKQLSGGQRRRLDLILATINKPELLLLDEPTTGMDPESRERTWSVVRDLHQGGVTVLLTTHYLEEAESMADRIAIMHEGHIAVTGALDDVLGDQPARICFKPPSGANMDELRRALQLGHGETFEAESQRDCTIMTYNLQEDLERVVTWASVHGHRLEHLSAAEATLAEVFHKVSSLRPGETFVGSETLSVESRSYA